jgi:transcriptional regulator with XRE-family HTH domain
MSETLKEKVTEKLISVIDRVSYLLSVKQMSQKQLATAMGVSEPYVSGLLNLKKKNLSLETIVKIESVFGENVIVNPTDLEESLTRNPDRLAYLVEVARGSLLSQQANKLVMVAKPEQELSTTHVSATVGLIGIANPHYDTRGYVHTNSTFITV